MLTYMLLYPVLFWKQKGGGTSAEGASREYRAPKARVSRRRRRRGGGVWGGGVPSPLGKESGEGSVPPPRKKIHFEAQNR